MNKTLNTNLLLCARNLNALASGSVADNHMEFASHSGALGPRRRVHGLLGLQVRSSSCIPDKWDNTVLTKQTNRRVSVFAFLPGRTWFGLRGVPPAAL